MPIDVRRKIEKNEIENAGEIVIKPDFIDYDNMYFETDNIDLIKLFATSQKIVEIAKKDVPSVPTLLSINDYPILYENSLCLLQGLKSTGKSRLGELIQTAVISKLNDGDVKRNESYSYQLLHIDTERATKNDFPRSIQIVKQRAGYDNQTQPNNYVPISLIEIPRKDRKEILKILIEGYINKHPEKQTIVILDVVQDLVDDLLDVKESSIIADYLNQLINQYNVSILCVIHENLSQIGQKSKDRKATGHLGSKLTEKSSTVWQTYRENDTFTFTCIYSRNFKPMPKDDVIQLQWNNDLRGLKMIEKINDPVIKQQLEKERLETQKKELENAIVSLLSRTGKLATTAFVEQLRKLTKDSLKLSKDEAKIKILEYAEKKLPIIETYHLTKHEPNGTAVYFSLENIEGKFDN